MTGKLARKNGSDLQRPWVPLVLGTYQGTRVPGHQGTLVPWYPGIQVPNCNTVTPNGQLVVHPGYQDTVGHHTIMLLVCCIRSSNTIRGRNTLLSEMHTLIPNATEPFVQHTVLSTVQCIVCLV